jgi:sugar lactone lactonase YvrE
MLGTPPSNLAQLPPVAVTDGVSAVTLNASASGDPAPWFGWQVSKDDGAHWQDISDGGNYEGTQTSSLTIKNATAGMSGYLYRYIATNYADSLFPDAPAKLYVTTDCFQSPTGVAVDAEGNIYITDASLHTVHQMDTQRAVAVMAGLARARGLVNARGDASRFDTPANLKIHPVSGVLHIADTGNDCVRLLNNSGITETAASGLNAPGGIAIDNDGNIYVADTGNHCIRKISPAGTISLLAGGGAPGRSGHVEANGADARFNMPAGLAVDANGFIYVADTGNHMIRYINPSNNFAGTLAGAAGVAGCSDGGPQHARFCSPRGLAVDGVLLSGKADGSLYVADTGNSLIREVTVDSVRTLAGFAGSDEEPAVSGVPGFQDGTGSNAWFRHPEDIAIGKNGSLVVADTGNGLLRQLAFDGDANAVVTTLAPVVPTAVGGTGGDDNPGNGTSGGGGGGGATSWLFGAGLATLAAARLCGKSEQAGQLSSRKNLPANPTGLGEK